MATPRSGRIQTGPLILAGITALGLGLRLYRIGAKGLWLDEAFSVWLGWQPWPRMLGWVVRIDQHPPLYYSLLHLWMKLGDGPATVRALSALAGAATIPVVYLLGRRLGGTRWGLVTALILAVSPFHVRFAQEARMYALLTFTASAGTFALACLLTDPRAYSMPIGGQLAARYRTWRLTHAAGHPASGKEARAPVGTDLAWAAYVVCTAATMLTHNTAILFPIAVNIFVLGLIVVRRRSGWVQVTPLGTESPLDPPSLRNWLIAQVAVLVLWSPWLPALIIQGRGVYREFWLPAPTAGVVIGTIGEFLNAHLPPFGPWIHLVWPLFGLGLAAGGFRLRRQPALLALLLTLILTPVAGELLASLVRPVFYGRTLIWAAIPLYLLLAAGILALRRPPVLILALAALVTVNSLSLAEYYVNFTKEEWREAAAYVAGQAQVDDMILFNAGWAQIPFDYYFRRAGSTVAEHGVPADLFERGVLEPIMMPGDLPRLNALVQGRGRIWLIYGHNWYTDPQGLIPAALDETLDFRARREFYGLEVRLYEGHVGASTP